MTGGGVLAKPAPFDSPASAGYKRLQIFRAFLVLRFLRLSIWIAVLAVIPSCNLPGLGYGTRKVDVDLTTTPAGATAFLIDHQVWSELQLKERIVELRALVALPSDAAVIAAKRNALLLDLEEFRVKSGKTAPLLRVRIETLVTVYVAVLDARIDYLVFQPGEYRASEGKTVLLDLGGVDD